MVLCDYGAAFRHLVPMTVTGFSSKPFSPDRPISLTDLSHAWRGRHHCWSWRSTTGWWSGRRRPPSCYSSPGQRWAPWHWGTPDLSPPSDTTRDASVQSSSSCITQTHKLNRTASMTQITNTHFGILLRKNYRINQLYVSPFELVCLQGGYI